MVQNKLLWAISEQTVAELVYRRSDANLPMMGMQSLDKKTDGLIKKSDVSIAKNYLNEDEIKLLGLLVEQYLAFAETMAQQRTPMYMNDWIERLDTILQLNGREPIFTIIHSRQIRYHCYISNIMKQLIQFLFLILFLSFADKMSSQNDVLPKYEVVLEDEIYVEKYDCSIVFNGKYTENNKCYLAGNKLLYDYYYMDLQGNKFKFQAFPVTVGMSFEEKKKAWRFVNIDSIDESTVMSVSLTVDTNYNHILYSFPGFDQSVILYDYCSLDGSVILNEGTGLIENDKNIWVHPPRSRMFSILELNPFPFIQAPYIVGNN